MATLIDSLVVAVGFDTKGLKKGIGEVTAGMKGVRGDVKRLGDDFERANKRAADSFKSVRNEVLSLLAVFTAGVGLKNFVGNTITGAASLGRMSKNLDISTRELYAWQKAAERAGGTAEGITAQLQESARSVGEFRLGQANGSTQAFFRFGGNVDDLKDGNRYLLARAKIVADLYKTDKARALVVSQQLGIDQSVYDLIKQGPAAIEDLLSAQRKRAAVTEADAVAADKLRIKFLDFRDSLESTSMKIVLRLQPALERLLAWFGQIADWIDLHQDDIAQWVDNATTAVIKFVDSANKAAEAVGGWQNVLLALVGLKVAGLVTNLVSLAAALGGVGGGLAKIAGSAGALRVLGPLGLLAYSPDLNTGEDAELARRRSMGPTIDTPGNTDRGSAAGVVAWLMKRGWSREQAIGIAANLQQESQFDPEMIGDNGKAYGIAQWHKDRQQKFKDVMGKDIVGSSVEDQLQFLDWELRNVKYLGGDKLKMETTASGAAGVVSKYYERPKEQVEEMRKRGVLADQITRVLGAGNATSAAANAAAASAYRPGQLAGSVTGDTTSSVHIGTLNVNTQATDAAGIARDIKPAVQRYNFASMANTGVN